MSDLYDIELPLFDIKHDKRFNRVFIYVPVLILGIVTLGCFYSRILPIYHNIFYIAEIFLIIVLMAVISWTRYGSQSEKHGAVFISLNEFVFKKDKNRLTVKISEVKKIVIASDYYQDFVTRDNQIHTGKISFKIVYKSNKAYAFDSILNSKKQLEHLQELLKKLYELKIIDERPYINGDRPLLLEPRTYEELQIMKKELGIVGQYF